MVSQNFLDQLYPQNTDDVILSLITIEESQLPGPQRFVRNTEDITSRGQTYLGYPFNITLPDDIENPSDTIVQLTIDNVQRELAQAVQLAQEPPQVTLEIVLGSARDVVERGPFIFEMRRVEFDKAKLSAGLAFQDLLDEPFPGYSFTPGDFPALFG